MTKLLLVRHGEIETEKIGRLWGHTNVALSPNGRIQAEKLAEALKQEKFTAIYASDLRRAVDTAAAIAQSHDMPVTHSVDLRELSFGSCEGLTWHEAAESFPEISQIWSGHGTSMPFPSGESLDDLAQRVDRFLTTLIPQSEESRDAGKNDATYLIVAHGGLLAVMICRLLGINSAHWWQYKIDYTSVSEFSPYPQGAVMVRFNDLSHLRECS